MKALITHGGLASCYEAILAGLPLIGIPMFADQKLNINNIVSKGAGLMLNFHNVNNETLSQALNAVLYDPQ